jgi:hypothetical protein
MKPGVGGTDRAPLTRSPAAPQWVSSTAGSGNSGISATLAHDDAQRERRLEPFGTSSVVTLQGARLLLPPGWGPSPDCLGGGDQLGRRASAARRCVHASSIIALADGMTAVMLNAPWMRPG